MKRMITIAIALFTLLLTQKIYGQASVIKLPAWVSKHGYWVVETNQHLPKESIVRFYTNNNELVYKEDIKGIRLKPGKRKVKMHLKKVLEKSIAEWTSSKSALENKDYVKAIFH